MGHNGANKHGFLQKCAIMARNGQISLGHNDAQAALGEVVGLELAQQGPSTDP